ncbi:CPCC family cysteine-rich protein [Streptomyces sp. R35]|uniref:CPCC family cysteine-rich protein n=1 Tax=Streptomyces sp. R35 TaxID=3238630 RepID=A0AB39SLA6_9ACTN
MNITGAPEAGPYQCPCCGYLTLRERGGFEICDVCFWEDDGQDDHDADVVRGGPNGSLSLNQARGNYCAFGACDQGSRKHVREPRADERLDSGRTYGRGVLKSAWE